MSHNTQKKIAIINDMSGFGRCAITVALPIISSLKVQCCPVPTSIFSNHTGFPSYFFDDYTEKLPAYIAQWKKLGLTFNGIETGFLGSKEQIEIVLAFLRDFKTEGSIVVVDPIMGDNGKTYATYTDAMCKEMRRLVCQADIITPNMTEACILSETMFHEDRWKMKEIEAVAEKLSQMGPEKVVITGIPQGDYIANYCYERGSGARLLRTLKVGTQRCGTGDIFAAIITADAVNGVPFPQSVKKASGFIKKCIQKSIELEIPVTDGVCFEEVLGSLR